MTYRSLLTKLRNYRTERGWVHQAPDDLAKSLMIEAAEILEIFQWSTGSKKDSNEIASSKKQELADEIGDVMVYLLGLCDDTGIDLLEATSNKLDKVMAKYPAERLKEKGFYMKQKKKYRDINN